MRDLWALAKGLLTETWSSRRAPPEAGGNWILYIIFPVAFCGAGTWQLKSDCGGIYRKHIRVTFFNWEEENCLRRFRLRWIHLPALTFSVSSKWGQFVRPGLDWRMILENICFICDITRLGRTYKAVLIISWGPVRQDTVLWKSKFLCLLPHLSFSLWHNFLRS